MDVWSKFLKGVMDHHRGIVIGVLLAIALSIGVVGCQPKTPSLLTPETKVALPELEREIVVIQNDLDGEVLTINMMIERHNANVEAFNESITLAQADIEQQLERRRQVIEMLGGVGTAIASGGLTAPAAIGSVVQLLLLGLAGGAGVDIVRKNRVINRLKKDGDKA